MALKYNHTYAQDIPEVFGLHSNADITYQINTAAGILDQILEVKFKMQMQILFTTFITS